MEVVISFAYWPIVGIISHLLVDCVWVVFISHLYIPQKGPFKGGNPGDMVC